jgi:hypothetical protein
MPRTEFAHSSGLEVMCRGIAEKTNQFSPNDILLLYRAGRLGDIFGSDGKIKPRFRRAITAAEARARLAERHPDGSPRKRCPMCGDPFDDDYRC